ncbi:MAG: DNA/RNA helicase domain-containing protein, partial [Anaerolineae bacterium]|nr:DNA/RNA helicase domain-containing protein [Anaerolineae bacterium]
MGINLGSKRPIRAYYSAPVARFCTQNTASIVGELTGNAAKAGAYQQLHTQTEAWSRQVTILRTALANCCEHAHLLLEYIIPRRGKRADAILLLRDLIFVIEFKIGARTFAAPDIAQVEDYALDLRDFHLASRERVVVPVLVATAATQMRELPRLDEAMLPATRLCNAEQLAQTLHHAVRRYSDSNRPAIDAAQWEYSEYRPTPTIIEIAQSLYAGKDVQEISRSHAGATNLTLTTAAVLRQIEQAKATGSKVICFVTGVPGAGKTLAGLNVVHNRELHEENLGVFLSGNGPLVKVLSEALARDYAEREGVSRHESRRRVRTFIQNVHHFLDHYFYSDELPADRVVVFDEAQRAWDAAQSERKFNRPFSEPEMMLEIMDRHDGWGAVIALVGGGQEINRGEA